MAWRWPWRREPTNGEAARAARADAVDELIEAHQRTWKVDQTVRDADRAAARAERFARETERALHLRGNAT